MGRILYRHGTDSRTCNVALPYLLDFLISDYFPLGVRLGSNFT